MELHEGTGVCGVFAVGSSPVQNLRFVVILNPTILATPINLYRSLLPLKALPF